MSHKLPKAIASSKSQTTQQTADLQPESLEVDDLPAQQPVSLVKQISPISNTPNPIAHAAMINRAVASPQSSQQVILQLQQQYGNRYVNRVLQQAQQLQTPIQAKLTLGAVGDKYEQEADAVAKQVVNQIQTSQLATTDQTPSVQRDMMAQKNKLQMKPADTIQREGVLDEENELGMNALLQRSATVDGGTITPELETSIQEARGRGKPLPDNIRQPMEQAFKADFSGVKVHADVQSDGLNQAVQAKAFTTGQDIFFRQGQYNPGSSIGQELLAHELTHVVQQTGKQITDIAGIQNSVNAKNSPLSSNIFDKSVTGTTQSEEMLEEKDNLRMKPIAEHQSSERHSSSLSELEISYDRLLMNEELIGLLETYWLQIALLFNQTQNETDSLQRAEKPEIALLLKLKEGGVSTSEFLETLSKINGFTLALIHLRQDLLSSQRAEISDLEKHSADEPLYLGDVLPELLRNKAFMDSVMKSQWDVIIKTSEIENMHYRYSLISKSSNPHIAALYELSTAGVTMAEFITQLKSLEQVDFDMEDLEGKYGSGNRSSSSNLLLSQESETSDAEKRSANELLYLSDVLPELLRNQDFMEFVMKSKWDIITLTSKKIRNKYPSISKDLDPYITTLYELSRARVTMGEFIAQLKSIPQVSPNKIEDLEGKYGSGNTSSSSNLFSSQESETLDLEKPSADESLYLSDVITKYPFNESFMEYVMKQHWKLITLTSNKIRNRYTSILKDPNPHMATLYELSTAGVTMAEFITQLKSLEQVDFDIEDLEGKYGSGNRLSSSNLTLSQKSETSNLEKPSADEPLYLSDVLPELLRVQSFIEYTMKGQWAIITLTSEKIRNKYPSISKDLDPHITTLYELSRAGVTIGEFIAQLKSLDQVDPIDIDYLEEKYGLGNGSSSSNPLSSKRSEATDFKKDFGTQKLYLKDVIQELLLNNLFLASMEENWSGIALLFDETRQKYSVLKKSFQPHIEILLELSKTGITLQNFFNTIKPKGNEIFLDVFPVDIKDLQEKYQLEV